MRILVTGGAGYIGSILVEELLRESNEITVIDNFMYGQTSLAHLCHDPDLTIIRGDIRNTSLMDSLIDWADTVVHLAAIVGAPACERDYFASESININALQGMLETLSVERNKDKPILIPISNSGYGIGKKDVECTEDMPLNPISKYGCDKVSQERLVMQRGNAISFRLATVFGMSPRMRMDLLINDFVWRAVKDKAVTLFEPHFKRNYIHVRDVARVFEFGIRHFGWLKNQIYNVGLSGANLSKLELCRRIAKHVPGFMFSIAGHGEDPDKRDYIVSNAKIEKAGFNTICSLDEGIKELITGYQMFRTNQYGNV